MLHINDLTFRIGGRLLFEDATLHIPQGHKVGLVGRNGTGKSTLLKVISGEVKVDSGDLELKQSLKIAVLDQEPRGDLQGSVFDVVAMGLGKNAKYLQDYHHALHDFTQNHND
ncbi:MAG: ABC transporter ATP-binding protein, partial [Rhodospirillaceae bacterium]